MTSSTSTLLRKHTRDIINNDIEQEGWLEKGLRGQMNRSTGINDSNNNEEDTQTMLIGNLSPMYHFV